MNSRKLITLVLIVVVVLFTGNIQQVSSSLAQSGLLDPNTLEEVGTSFTYQGILKDISGNPISSTCDFRFILYDADAGGSQVGSTLVKTIAVVSGYFTVVLDFGSGIFIGKARWLEVAVKCSGEIDYTTLSPRQAVTAAPFAIYSFNTASHSHAGEDIVSGTVADARIASTLARDSEIMPMILNNDGTGSGLDADLLDGLHASAFAISSHLHDDRYYTETEANSLFVNAAGDTMTGVLTVPRINYASPRTHYFMIGGEGFQPGSNVAYYNTYGNGGAYIVSGTGAMVAPVHLPQGAVVTAFRVFFYDNSASDLSVSLSRLYMTAGYANLADVYSSGVPGYANITDTTIDYATIDNTLYPYHIYAYCSSWDGTNLRIMGALITYTISEAP